MLIDIARPLLVIARVSTRFYCKRKDGSPSAGHQVPPTSGVERTSDTTAKGPNSLIHPVLQKDWSQVG
eukprot:497151-Amphidinium_carterae.2